MWPASVPIIYTWYIFPHAGLLCLSPPIRHHFGKYGTLADIALMKDKYTGHPRGFGFIKFEDLTGGLFALLLDGKTVFSIRSLFHVNSTICRY